MADLIPRKATLERMKSMAGCATCDNYNYVRCRACIWDDAMNIVEEMSEVEAVPVVWLKKMRDDDRLTIDDVETIDLILTWWQKEQEAR